MSTVVEEGRAEIVLVSTNCAGYPGPSSSCASRKAWREKMTHSPVKISDCEPPWDTLKEVCNWGRKFRWCLRTSKRSGWDRPAAPVSQMGLPGFAQTALFFAMICKLLFLCCFKLADFLRLSINCFILYISTVGWKQTCSIVWVQSLTKKIWNQD